MFYVEKRQNKKKKKMGREPETNQTFHRTFADKKAEECRGRKNLPQREERKKLKPSVLTFAKEGERALLKLPINQVKVTVGSDRVHTP